MDWTQIIADLNAAGWTQVMIAEACQCEQTRISRIKRGDTLDPGYRLGIALVELHRRRHAGKRTARA